MSIGHAAYRASSMAAGQSDSPYPQDKQLSDYAQRCTPEFELIDKGHPHGSDTHSALVWLSRLCRCKTSHNSGKPEYRAENGSDTLHIL